MNLASSALQHWYEDVWNQAHEARIDALVHPEAVIHGLDLDPNRRGPALFREFYRSFTGAFADIRVTVQHVVGEDDYETALLGIAARHRESGQPVSFTGLTMVRLQNGQIHEAWNHIDFLTMYRQLGQELAPAPVPVA